MSFTSQFIKLNNEFGHYRQPEISKEDYSSQYHESLKSSTSTFRPKSTRDKKLSTYKFSIKKTNFRFNKDEVLDENLKNIKKMNNYNEIFENIVVLLNNIINNNKNDEIQLCKLLKLIYKFIYEINNNHNNNLNNNFNNNHKASPEHNLTLTVGQNSKRIKKSRTCNTSKNIRIQNKDYHYQSNEYNYLIYINELHKKLHRLETELNIKSAKKKSTKENIRLLFSMDTSKYYSKNDLKVRKSSFSINAEKKNFKINELLEGKKKKNLKISLKDIYDEYEKNVNKDVKFYNNEKYLLSHPRLNYNGYIHNNNGILSSKVNEKLNRIPKEAFGVNLLTKVQMNYKSYLQLTFNPIKFRLEKLRSNKKIKGSED